MKKSINVFWILSLLMSLAILILSSLECIRGISHSLPMSDVSEPIVKSSNLISLVGVPTVFSLIALFFENKALNILAAISLFIQAIVVSFAHKICKAIDDLFSYIGSRSYTYEMTTLGVIVCILCWIVFLLSIVMAYGRLKCKKSVEADTKTTNLLIAILSVILALVSLPIVLFRIGIVIEISIPFGLLFLILTLSLIFFAYFYPIKRTLKTQNKNYLWIMVFLIVVFLIQIIFKDKIIEIWNNIFCSICGPGGIPDTLD